MSLRPYTTIHDLTDEFCLHCGEHPFNQYRVKYWNYVDGNYMNIAWDSFTHSIDRNGDDVWEAIFRASKHELPIQFNFTHEWATFLKKIDRGTFEWDCARVVVINIDNGKRMHMSFTSHSNVDREIGYSINYDDPNYHRLRWKMRFGWVNIKFRVNRWWTNVVKNFKPY